MTPAPVIAAAAGWPIAATCLACFALLILCGFALQRRRMIKTAQALRETGFDVTTEWVPSVAAWEIAWLVRDNSVLPDHGAFTLRSRGQVAGSEGGVVEYSHRRSFAGRRSAPLRHSIAYCRLNASDIPFTLARRGFRAVNGPGRASIADIDDRQVADLYWCYPAELKGVWALDAPGIRDRVLAWDRKWWVRFDGERLIIGRREPLSPAVARKLVHELTTIVDLLHRSGRTRVTTK